MTPRKRSQLAPIIWSSVVRSPKPPIRRLQRVPCSTICARLSEFDLEAALRERGALLYGHFRLSSGRHSDRFIQKFRILESPPLVEAVAKEIAAAFRSVKPTIVVSAAVGGIVLGYEVARQLGTDAIFVEKKNGIATLRRGFHSRLRIARSSSRMS